jgi:hypothetical protein
MVYVLPCLKKIVYSKKKYFLSSIFLIGWVGIIVGIVIFGWSDTWRSVLLPSMSPPFADMRTIQGSLESSAQGLNPQIENPGDPWHRRMNYPSIWTEIADILHFEKELNFLIYVSITVLLYIYCSYRIMLMTESYVMLLIVFSGSSLLAVERGNNDIVIFSLLYLAANISPLSRVVTLLIATALKIYPICVLPTLLKEKLNAVFFGILGFMIIAFMWREIVYILKGIPISAGLSYGASSIARGVTKVAGDRIPFEINIWHISLILMIALIFFYASTFRLLDATTKNNNELNTRLFLFGSCIFLGTFLLSSNCDYRLIFIFFCIPYIMSIHNTTIKYIILTFIILATNYPLLFFAMGTAGIIVNILAKSALFVLLGVMLTNLIKKDYLSLKT